MESKKFSLNQADLESIGKGLLIALAGATLTYITEVIGKVSFGPIWTPLVVAFWSVLVNILRKYLAGK